MGDVVVVVVVVGLTLREFWNAEIAIRLARPHGTTVLCAVVRGIGQNCVQTMI